MSELPRRANRRVRRPGSTPPAELRRPRNPWPAIAAFVAAVVIALALLGTCVAFFVSSVPEERLDVPLSELTPGAPRFYPRVNFGADASGSTFGVWLVRQPGSGVLALFSRDAHSDCAVVWRGDLNYQGTGPVFSEPCDGAVWDVGGRRLAGPATRGLDRFDATLGSTAVTVRLDRLQLGACAGDAAGNGAGGQDCSAPGAPVYRSRPPAVNLAGFGPR